MSILYSSRMSRTERLRHLLQWSQKRMADYLGQRQSTICRLEAGQKETGPQSIVLDQLERDIAEGRIAVKEQVTP